MNRHRLRTFIRDLTLLLILLSTIGNLSCERQKEENLQSKGNLPPTISSVLIFPEKPRKEDELHVTVQGQDRDGDPISYRYQWIKNSKEIYGENNNILKGEHFRKGDVIQVNVMPNDGKIDGTSFLSPPLKIINSPPILQELWIEPKTAY